MKFLVVCMFALMASSMAGVAKKDKRHLLGYENAGYVSHGYPSSNYVESHHTPLIATEHTHSVERVNVAVPYPVERINEQIVHVDNPIPKPYPVEVVRHVAEPIHIDRPVAQPYPVHVNVPVEQPIAVPVERVRTVVKQVPVAQHYERHIPQPYPVYIHQQPAVHAAQIYSAPSHAVHSIPASWVHASHGVHAAAPAYYSTRTAHGPLATALNSPLNSW